MTEVMTELANFLTTHEASLRLFGMFGLLAVFFVLERLRPRRQQKVGITHMGGNMLVGFLNGGLVRLVLPGGLAVLALWNEGGGLLGLMALPIWLEWLLAVILLDLVLYWHHRAFHEIDLLWRFHGAHHSDRNLNVTSGMRFHPGEALVSAAIKAAAVVLIGAPAAAVILFEILLNGASLFNHTNWHLGRADKILQRLIVTPDMHRLHHSRAPDESRRNYGFFLSIWDRLFASYQADPQQAHEVIDLGLAEAKKDNLPAMLIQPFHR